MTTVRYTGVLDNRNLENLFLPDGLINVHVDDDGKHGYFDDNIYLSSVHLYGKKFNQGTGSTEDDFISGKANRVEFHTYADTFVTVEGNFKATQMSAQVDAGGMPALIKFMFAESDKLVGSKVGDNLNGYGGKDILKGNGGRDNINGGLGAGDKLFGGKDSDYFILNTKNGADIVADFDAKGKDHDWIHVDEGVGFAVHSNKHNEVVISTQGASLTLEGISKHHFHADWVVHDLAQPEIF